MQKETSIKTRHPIQPFLFVGILIILAYIFFNSAQISNQNIILSVLILVVCSILYWLSITTNIISIKEDTLRIESKNLLPFSKAKDLKIKLKEIDSVFYQYDRETLNIGIGNSKVIYLRANSFTANSKKLKSLYLTLLLKIPSEKTEAFSKKIIKERKSLWKEVKIILILISCLFIIPTITAHSNLSEPIKRFIMACTIFGFILSCMSIGLYIHFKNK